MPTTFKLAWKNMWVRKLRTVLSVLGIAAGLELVILLTTILDFTEQSVEGELAKYAGQMYVRSQTLAGWAGQEFPPISSTMTEEEANQIMKELEGRAVDGGTTPVLFRQLAPPPWPSAPPQALAVGLEVGKLRAYLGADTEVVEGILSFSGPEAREVILGPMAHMFFKEPVIGEQVEIGGERLRVVALVRGTNEVDRVVMGAVLLPLRTAQQLFHQPGSVSAVLVTASQVSDVVSLAQTIREKHPKLAVLTQEDMAKNLDQALSGMRVFFNLINNAVYAIAAVVVLIVMVMAVAERTREIGTVRAIGGSRWLVLRTIVLEAAMLGLMGGLLSIPVAYIVDRFVHFGLKELGQATTLIRVVFIGVFIAAVAALLPAWRATRVDPVEALRYE